MNEKPPTIDQVEMTDADIEFAERIAKRLGFTQTASTSSSALFGLFCLPDHAKHRHGCIIKTKQFGFMFVADLEDMQLHDLHEETTRPSLYAECKALGIPHDSHASDLYLPATDQTRALVKKHGKKASGFTSNIDGKQWLDVPFAFDPWWEAKQKQKPLATVIAEPSKQEAVAAKRAEYIENKITHQEYYEWLSAFIGLGYRSIPFTAAQVDASKDPHLNDLPLATWDRAHDYVKSFATGLNWSLSDTVCCLKALARKRQAKQALAKIK